MRHPEHSRHYSLEARQKLDAIYRRIDRNQMMKEAEQLKYPEGRLPTPWPERYQRLYDKWLELEHEGFAIRLHESRRFNDELSSKYCEKLRKLHSIWRYLPEDDPRKVATQAAIEKLVNHINGQMEGLAYLFVPELKPTNRLCGGISDSALNEIASDYVSKAGC